MAVVLIAVVPPAFVVKLVRAVVPPIIPESVVVPVELRSNVNAPLIIPPKVLDPVPDDIVEFEVKTIGVPESPIEIGAFVVETVPPILTWIGAVAVNPATNEVVSPLSPIVTYPELLKVVIPAIEFVPPVNITL